MISARMLAMCAVLLTGICAGAADAPHPVAMQVKAALKDPTKPFVLIVQLKVKDGSEGKFEAAFAKAVKPTLAEKGCVAYQLSKDAKTPTQYVVYERWQNLAALEAHLKAPHIVTLLAEVGDLFAAPPEGRVLLPTGE